MSRVLSVCVLALATVATSTAFAEKKMSGLKEGDSIGAFTVTKVAGAEDDGTAIGANLCYRCKNKSRPQVMVFTRSTDDKVVKLVKEIDGSLKKFEGQQLRAFVNMLGKSKASATENVKKLAKISKTTRVPFVVPDDYSNGPRNYKISKDAEIVVVVANEGEVVKNMAFAKASQTDIAAVVKSIRTMLN